MSSPSSPSVEKFWDLNGEYDDTIFLTAEDQEDWFGFLEEPHVPTSQGEWGSDGPFIETRSNSTSRKEENGPHMLTTNVSGVQSMTQ